MSTTRNAPCPCGSGRKHKHCCGKAAVSAFPAPVRAVKALALTAQGQLMDYVSRTRGIAGVALAWAAFSGAKDLDLGDAELYEAAFEGLNGHVFAAWYLSLWLEDDPDDGQPEQWPSPNTLAADFLRLPQRASAAVRGYVEAWRRAPLSFWEVLEVEQGLSVTLRDHCLQRELVVYDHSVASVVSRWDNLFAQVIDVDGIHVFGGVGSTVIPARFTPDLREIGERIAAQGDIRHPEDLLKVDLDLVDLHVGIEDAVHRPVAPPLIRNTDGDALVPVTSTYAIAKGRLNELRAALLEMEDIWAEGADDPQPTAFLWLVETPGTGLDNTVKGQIRIKGAKLSVLTNSRERDIALRQLLDEALGEWVTYVGTIVPPLELSQGVARAIGQAMASPGRTDASASGWRSPAAQRAMDQPSPTEMADIERQIMAPLILRWAGETIPALGDRTPEQAVRTAEGRQAVIDLINGWENMSDRAGDDLGDVFNALRRRLGLAEA
jgi:hypothetical protein